MIQFYKTVDKRNRKAMIDFLCRHFRYSTMNGWNRSTSYANCLKIHSLGLPSEIEDKLFDMFQCQSFYWPIEDLIREFAEDYNYEWQAGFNGRSGGYLVLYQGYSKPSGHKSYCQSCWQKNFTSITETGTRCGRCGSETRIDFEVPPMEYGAYPGRSTDQGEDFEDWSMSDLRDRVELVQCFDKLCDAIVQISVETAQTMDVEEYEVMVPVKRTRLVAV